MSESALNAASIIVQDEFARIETERYEHAREERSSRTAVALTIVLSALGTLVVVVLALAVQVGALSASAALLSGLLTWLLLPVIVVLGFLIWLAGASASADKRRKRPR